MYFQLLYKATIDGDKAEFFHNKVDGKSPLIIFVKNTEDMIFGGYTSAAWSSSNDYQSDSEAFLFSLNNMKIYNIIKCNNACFHSKIYGPFFGNSSELNIVDNCFEEYSMTNCIFDCYNLNKINLIGKNEFSFFKVKDYEVYKIISYDN